MKPFILFGESCIFDNTTLSNFSKLYTPFNYIKPKDFSISKLYCDIINSYRFVSETQTLSEFHMQTYSIPIVLLFNYFYQL